MKSRWVSAPIEQKQNWASRQRDKANVTFEMLSPRPRQQQPVMGQHTTTILHCKHQRRATNCAASRVIVFQENYQPRKKVRSIFTQTNNLITNNLPSQSQTHTTMAEAMFKEGIETKTAEVILSMFYLIKIFYNILKYMLEQSA